MRTSSAAATALALALLAGGCGSSDTPARVETFFHGTVDATSAFSVSGTAIDGRGAVVRYLDDGRTLTVGSDPAELRLPAGSVVAVRGRVAADASAATADEVVVRSALRGPLLGRGEWSLAIAGADVLLDERTTVLDADGAPSAGEALPSRALVEVHGWPEGGNRLRATLVRALPGSVPLTVHGWSLAAASSGGVFDLSLVQGGAPLLRVDASGATSTASIPANALVRVVGGDITAGSPPVLGATSVDIVAQLLPIGEERAVVEGVVSGGSAADFTLGDHRVRTTATTRYEGGGEEGSPEALVFPGMRLVAEGPLVRGTVVAERLRFVNVLRLAGRIVPGSFAILNPATGASFQLGGSIVVVDGTARLVSRGSAITLVQLLELHGLEPAGLPVVVHGYLRGDGAVRAQRIEVTGG